MSDEYGALTMVLLRLFAFAPVAPVAPGATTVSGGGPGPVSEVRPPPASATQAASPATRSPAVSSPLRASAAPAIQVPVAAKPAGPAPAPVARRVTAPEPASAASVAVLNEREPSPYGGRAATAPAFAPVTPPSAAADSPAPAPRADVAADTALGDRWQALATRLADRGSIAALTREMAWQAGLVRIDDGTDGTEPAVWHLCVERDSLRTSALGDKLAAALAADLGQPLRIEFQSGVPTDTPARREAAERARRQAEAERSIRGDPLVQELLSQFKGARIVPGSIKPVPL
jgi:DNA polymerase-3 subunit gamma/tau